MWGMEDGVWNVENGTERLEDRVWSIEDGTGDCRIQHGHGEYGNWRMEGGA